MDVAGTFGFSQQQIGCTYVGVHLSRHRRLYIQAKGRFGAERCSPRCKFVSFYGIHINVMPKAEMPAGSLALLILRVLRGGPLHGYAIAQRIHVLSEDVLRIEEGALYPTLQKILVKGWVRSDWGISETNRKVRFYRLTSAGRKELDGQLAAYERLHGAIQLVLTKA